MNAAWLAVVVLATGCPSKSRGAWIPYTSGEGRFHVDMPGTVQVATNPQIGAQVHTSLVDRGSNGSFQVAYYDLAAPLSGDTAESAAKLDCLTGVIEGASVIDQHAQTLGTARGFVVTTQQPHSTEHPNGAWSEQRCFVAKGRMFHLLAVGPDTADQKRDAARFMTTFGVD